MRSASRDGIVARDEVKSLVGKIERGLETRGQIKQRGIEPADRRRQRALELVHRRASLERRDRVHQIRHGLRLYQVQSSMQVRAKREFTGLGEPRAGGHREPDETLQDGRAAVRAELDDVLAGVGVRRGEPRGHHVIDRLARPRSDPRLARMSRVVAAAAPCDR